MCFASEDAGKRREEWSMLRVRFHGRGGHGIKTASRILGTAAFLGGLQAQDSLIYGAERRGAALAAFTRIDRGPICERGVIVDPDLVVVADETLLADPCAGVLVGSDLASAMFVNSPGEGQNLAAHYGIRCPVLTADLTALSTELLGRGSALSASLGAVGCRLAGLESVDLLARAVREELADLQLSPEAMERNVALALRVHTAVLPVQLSERAAPAGACALHAPTYAGAPGGVPVIVNPGNAAARHTGSWRVFHPLIDLDACTRCGICAVFCPDGVIALDANGYPVIDYDNCKGCMICREECPVHCIAEQKEVRA
jgi:pyruvate ferredoxin oxidoreductase gamma subunit